MLSEVRQRKIQKKLKGPKNAQFWSLKTWGHGIRPPEPLDLLVQDNQCQEMQPDKQHKTYLFLSREVKFPLCRNKYL